MYPQKFYPGEAVKIATRVVLEAFLRTWRVHNKLDEPQLEFAEQTATVKKSVFSRSSVLA